MITQMKIAVSGVKNSGKTTLISALIPELKKLGLKVAVIKHDGHEFEADTPGTDSYRAREAGAYGTAVFSDTKYLVVKEQPEMNQEKRAEELGKLFPEADLILLEGFKNSSYPKVEVVRKENSRTPVCIGKNLLAMVSDLDRDSLELPGEIPLFSLNGAAELAAYLVRVCKEEQIAESAPAQEAWEDLHPAASTRALEGEYHPDTARSLGPEVSMVILAGGKSSRMGRDKSDLLLGQKTFLELQIEKGRSLGISDILVSGYRGNRCTVPVIKDRMLEKGPLGGLEACFRQVKHSFVLVLCVDVPLVPVEELRKMMAIALKEQQPVILRHGDRLEPMMGVFPADMADAMVEEIQQGRGRIFHVLEKRGYHVYETKEEDKLFRNVNDPQEYGCLLQQKVQMEQTNG
ncbi:MAG: molybdopterin-guanine dinucleotide biosynthesis protein B [Lachnospiraceae bacterium]|nr:molybdopterin-guanine dinucleotide biosynthesis protein B [Lachnospiraceae bacterium]